MDARRRIARTRRSRVLDRGHQGRSQSPGFERLVRCFGAERVREGPGRGSGRMVRSSSCGERRRQPASGLEAAGAAESTVERGVDDAGRRHQLRADGHAGHPVMGRDDQYHGATGRWHLGPTSGQHALEGAVRRAPGRVPEASATAGGRLSPSAGQPAEIPDSSLDSAAGQADPGRNDPGLDPQVKGGVSR